jgi:ABC-type polysaccharide/polyol phosphate transport system ATPase subunit
MIVLSAESVAKRYRVRHASPETVRETSIRWLRGERHAREAVWALRDVSFDVAQGRALGVIGHNGAGKSTLLRALCGVTLPTSGRVVVRSGSVSGLLELGGGFHLDCTGRQNVMTAGLLNGLTAVEVRAREREIIAFAELEDVIDCPVRTYSSGMYLRLAFAVAVHFDPAILVIDEVLAVGDARFQQKCLARILAFREAGKTLVLTSHIPEQIKRLCDDVLVLDEGRVVMRGAPKEALGCYDDLMRQRTERRARALCGEGAPAPLPAGGGTRQGTQEGTIETVRLRDLKGRVTAAIAPGDGLEVELDVRLPAAGADFALGLGIYSEARDKCFEMLIDSGLAKFGALAERATLGCVLPALPLLPGRYILAVGLYPPDCDYVWDYHWGMHQVHVLGDRSPGHVSGVLDLHPRWHVSDGVPDTRDCRRGGACQAAV